MKNDPTHKFFHEIMGIELLPATSGKARARMAVTHAVCQPFGFLSGGAMLALAETLAGYGSLSLCDEGYVPLGIQVSANHLHAVPLGGGSGSLGVPALQRTLHTCLERGYHRRRRSTRFYLPCHELHKKRTVS